MQHSSYFPSKENLTEAGSDRMFFHFFFPWTVFQLAWCV